MKRWTPLPVAAVVLLASCGGGGDHAAAPRAATQVTTEKAITRTFDAPSVVIARDDPNSLFLAAVELQSGRCSFYTSPDLGVTWTAGTGPSLPPYNNCGPGSAHPENIRTELHQASDGALLYLYAGNDPAAGGSRSLVMARSTDRGRTWSATAVDAAPRAASLVDAELDFMGHFAIDPDNPKNVYVTWRRTFANVKGSTHPTNRPAMAVSTDGGVSFGQPFQPFDRTIGFDGPQPFLVGGVLWAAYMDSAAKPVNLYVSSSSDSGRTWKENVVSSAPGADAPVPAYDSHTKTFHLVWDDTRNGDADVFHSGSSDGVHWSGPTRLNDDPQKNGRGQLFPAIASAPGGRLDVVWYDYRNDPYPPSKDGDLGNRQDLYMSSSTDGGSTWSANVRVNGYTIDRTKGTWNNQYALTIPPALVATDDVDLAAWSDTRNGDVQTGTQDIYASPVSFTGAPAGQTAGYSRGDLIAVGIVTGLGALLGGAGIAMLFLGRTARRRQQPTG